MYTNIIDTKTTDGLRGLTGDNGETIIVFIRNWKNPLDSCWAWFHTEKDAKAFSQSIEDERG